MCVSVSSSRQDSSQSNLRGMSLLDKIPQSMGHKYGVARGSPSHLRLLGAGGYRFDFTLRRYFAIYILSFVLVSATLPDLDSATWLNLSLPSFIIPTYQYCTAAKYRQIHHSILSAIFLSSRRFLFSTNDKCCETAFFPTVGAMLGSPACQQRFYHNSWQPQEFCKIAHV